MTILSAEEHRAEGDTGTPGGGTEPHRAVQRRAGEDVQPLCHLRGGSQGRRSRRLHGGHHGICRSPGQPHRRGSRDCPHGG